MKVYNIQWDQEKDDPTVLPREMEVPDWMRADDISDYITEQTGYCHFGFRIAKRGVEYYRKLGLTEERYNQMMKDFNSEQWIDEVIND